MTLIGSLSSAYTVGSQVERATKRRFIRRQPLGSSGTGAGAGMTTPSRTANLARSARAPRPAIQMTATSTGMPTRKRGISPIPRPMPITTTVNKTNPITSPASRWMTASQVRGDTRAPRTASGPPGELRPLAMLSAPAAGELRPSGELQLRAGHRNRSRLPPSACLLAAVVILPADPTHPVLACPYRWPPGTPGGYPYPGFGGQRDAAPRPARRGFQRSVLLANQRWRPA